MSAYGARISRLFEQKLSAFNYQIFELFFIYRIEEKYRDF